MFGGGGFDFFLKKRAKNWIHTWLFGSSKCVKFRKIIFNCTIQITEEVKRCTSCSKQQESPVSSRSLVAWHPWSYWKQFLTPARYQEATVRSREGSADQLESSYSCTGARRIMPQNCPYSISWVIQSDVLVNHSVRHTSACWGFIECLHWRGPGRHTLPRKKRAATILQP